MPTPAAPGAGVLRALVARATLAPSTRNVQPWRWTVLRDHIELELDEQVARPLALDDPVRRELVMSCGASLLTLRVAAAEALLDTRVDALPDPHRPGLLAEVTLEQGAIDTDFSELDAVVPLRHTAWSAFDGRPLPEGLAARLAAEARIEGAVLHEVDPAARAELAELLRHADHERHHDPRAARHLDLGDQVADHEAALLGDAPYVAVLATPGDTVADWLAAGQALQRVLLVAAAREVLGGFLNAPCQVAADRVRLRALLSDRAYPQVVLRLGHPTTRPVGTPRRPVAEVVTVQDGPQSDGAEPAPLVTRELGADLTEDSLG